MTLAGYVGFGGKTKDCMVMRAFTEGCDGQLIVLREPVPDWSREDHAIYGMWPFQMALARALLAAGKPLWYIDNGWFVNLWKVGRLHPEAAFYRVSRNGLAPKFLPGKSMERANKFDVRIKPWRTGGRHVLVCLPYNPEYASGFGVDIHQWLADLKILLPSVTDRPIVYREKPRDVTRITPLGEALKNAWCLVTHSSNAAVEAAMVGVPVFCEPVCGAAMVGCTDFTKIETPIYPDNREEWIASLMWQQFSLNEFRSGLAWQTLA